MKEKTFWVAAAILFAAIFFFYLSRKTPDITETDTAPLTAQPQQAAPVIDPKSAMESTAPAPINPAQEFWKGDILDLAAISNAEINDTVRHYFRLFKERSEIEAALITVPSLNGEKISSLAERIFWKWDLPEGKDKALLFLIAYKEGVAAFWLGKDLQNLLSEKDIDDALKVEFYPAYQQGNILGAIWSTIAKIHNFLYERKNNPLSDKQGIFFISIFVGLFIAIGFAAVGYAIGSRQVFFMIWGAFFGGLPFFFTSMAFLKSGLALPFLFHSCLAVGMTVLGRRLGEKKRRNR